jgi:hypothetical protein
MANNMINGMAKTKKIRIKKYPIKMKTLIVAPIHREIMLKLKREMKSSNEKPGFDFLTTKLRHGEKRVLKN